MLLTKIESLAKSNGFGTKNTDGFENRVLKATWSAGNSDDIVQLVSERKIFAGNIILPDNIEATEAGLNSYKEKIQAALNEGKLKMYGHLVYVKECDSDHTKVRNTANNHIIEAFPRAWKSENHAEIVEVVRRDLQKSIAKTKMDWVAG